MESDCISSGSLLIFLLCFIPLGSRIKNFFVKMAKVQCKIEVERRTQDLFQYKTH